VEADQLPTVLGLSPGPALESSGVPLTLFVVAPPFFFGCLDPFVTSGWAIEPARRSEPPLARRFRLTFQPLIEFVFPRLGFLSIGVSGLVYYGLRAFLWCFALVQFTRLEAPSPALFFYLLQLLGRRGGSSTS